MRERGKVNKFHCAFQADYVVRHPIYAEVTLPPPASKVSIYSPGLHSFKSIATFKL
jgi:hypothetical protein